LLVFFFISGPSTLVVFLFLDGVSFPFLDPSCTRMPSRGFSPQTSFMRAGPIPFVLFTRLVPTWFPPPVSLRPCPHFCLFLKCFWFAFPGERLKRLFAPFCPLICVFFVFGSRWCFSRPSISLSCRLHLFYGPFPPPIPFPLVPFASFFCAPPDSQQIFTPSRLSSWSVQRAGFAL